MMIKGITLSFALSLPLLAAPALSSIDSSPMPRQSRSVLACLSSSLPLDPQELAFLQGLDRIRPSAIDETAASLGEGDPLPIPNQWFPAAFEAKGDGIQTWKFAVAILGLLLVLREYVINRYQSRLEHLNKELEQISNTDPLTGIANRHFLNDVFARESAKARRYRSKFAVIMLDVDHFKTINDLFGHTEGDRILKHIARAVADTIRTPDTAGRWGGEEFLVLCPETDLNEARQLAETIRRKIERLDFGLPMKVTIGLGVIEYKNHPSLEHLVKMADDALYEAKNSEQALEEHREDRPNRSAGRKRLHKDHDKTG
ncbi:GGDEF domain-containing protein [Methylosarcina fibrata]|uniref:GGDEF domain-containing protein n=1 Tax=Methylosarcina fibrata TaxID=105972 RepID=UPI00036F356F|nr:GGDEF domain-containing protein [Methylosarcina fibrata]